MLEGVNASWLDLPSTVPVTSEVPLKAAVDGCVNW